MAGPLVGTNDTGVEGTGVAVVVGTESSPQAAKKQTANADKQSRPKRNFIPYCGHNRVIRKFRLEARL
jgi:hypothetical protein